jgi:O-antigen/teichoic acid export membrane protein
MCAIASPAAVFFSEPRVEGLMYALALNPLIQGFDNIGVVAFQKDLELHKEFWFGLAKKLAGFAVTIALAFVLHNYWALVFGTISTRITSLILSYRLHPFRPRFSFAAAGELFHFSKWMLLNNLLIFLNNRGTDFVIGKVSGARALGLYSVAYQLANLPTTELVWPISRAVFPGYARLAGYPEKLRPVFLQVIGLVALLTIPAGAGIGLVAEPLVQLLLGPKWMEAVPLIQVLAVFGVVRSLHGPTGSIYLALGKPRIVAVLQCVQLVIAIGLMLLLVPKLGPIGAAWAILAGATVAMTSNYIMVLRELSLPLGDLLAVVWRPIVAALVMVLTLIALASSLWPVETGPGLTAMRLAVLIAVGSLSYAATIIGCWYFAGKPRGTEFDLMAIVASRVPRFF